MNKNNSTRQIFNVNNNGDDDPLIEIIQIGTKKKQS